MSQVICHSEEETIALGESFGSSLPKGTIVCFFGDLGAGKTTFIKGLVKGYSGYSSEHVNSPTFVYLNIYTGTETVYHFDLYRLRDSDEFLSMGFDEMFHADGICLIEWSEKIENILPEKRLNITIEHMGENSRKIRLG